MYKYLIFLLFPCFAQAQKVKLSTGLPQQTTVYRGALGADSGIYVGSGCGNPALLINLAPFYAVYKGALVYKDTCNDIVYTSNPDQSWTALVSGGGSTFTIDTTFTLDGSILLLTVPHGLAATPDEVRVEVDNTQGLTTFVQPYADATNVYIPYSIGPICTCQYQIKITP